MTKPQQTDGQAGGAEGIRANTNPVTPGEAKALWHMMEKPTSRKVANWFTAAGRPVSDDLLVTGDLYGFDWHRGKFRVERRNVLLGILDLRTLAVTPIVPSTSSI